MSTSSSAGAAAYARLGSGSFGRPRWGVVTAVGWEVGGGAARSIAKTITIVFVKIQQPNVLRASGRPQEQTTNGDKTSPTSPHPPNSPRNPRANAPTRAPGTYYNIRLNIMGEPHVYDATYPQPPPRICEPHSNGAMRTMGRPTWLTQYPKNIH